MASPVSVSSGEEYDPSRGDTAAAMSVAAPKPRHPQPKIPKLKNKKTTSSKSKQSTFSTHSILSIIIYSLFLSILALPNNMFATRIRSTLAACLHLITARR